MSTATPLATAAAAPLQRKNNGLRTGFLTPPHAPQLHNSPSNSQLSMMMSGNDLDAASRASSEDRETAMVVDPGLQVYWHGLALEHRKKLLKLSKKDLFTKIRTSCCSGCYGLFQMRYDELKNHLSGSCPVCHDCYAGLVITEDGGVTLGEQILVSNPFPTFGESRCREREREMHFMTGDICGSGWQKKPGQNKCKLHTSHVPYEALSEYWTGLPCEQQATLLVLSEEQFVSELDGQMKCQLRICKECRCNVMRAFKELKPGRDGVQLQPSLPLCPNHELKFCDGMVKVEGTGEPVFFEAAEEVEEHKTFDPSTGNDTDNPDTIRHAETPELAREALQDSALLIFKSQVEVSFREQTASQNALLLFVYLIHTLMELQLGNAYKELSAKQADDGDAAFDVMLAAMSEATECLLVQFFIFHDDDLGRRVQRLLLERAAAGVTVCVLYDGVGSHDLPRHYVDTLRAGGVAIHAFATHRWRNRFQLNFRNHRKIVVVDGTRAFVGGLNVGDEYLGLKPPLAPWRDTHMELRGPAVSDLQQLFARDWQWITGKAPPLLPSPSGIGDASALVVASGPADAQETCSLFFTAAIHAARTRLWLTTPYFVPDNAVLAALRLAVARGVDVRILIPSRPDHRTVFLASTLHAFEALTAGIRIYRYQPGFTHQKVLLIDDDTAAVGSMNLDSRSFRLNFEVSALIVDHAFASEVEAMLQNDFSRALLVDKAEYLDAPYLRRVAMHVARLFDPLL
ncbi:MAG: hypothetical protein WDW36_000922 [Sanguina aurantia]